MKDYPRIGSKQKHNLKNRCAVCGGLKPDLRIDVEVNNFRGDDDVYLIHTECFDDLKKKVGIK